MGKIKGQKEYEKFKAGDKLSRKQAMLAHCYMCNGEEESAADCQGKSCPMYQFQHFRGKKTRKQQKEAQIAEPVEIGA